MSRFFSTATAGLFLCLAASGFLRAEEPQPLRAVIDRRVEAVWQREKVTAAPLSDDATFLRRVSLDLIGVIPTYEEAGSFLADPNPDKRAALIDRLLDDPRYAQHQMEVWDGILFGRNPPGHGTDRRDGFQAWMRDQFKNNVPYDRWARAILRAEGNSVDEGPPMFFVQYNRQPEDAAEAVTQRFLGVQLQCARCHNHPFESWTQLDFYGVAAFFARLEVVEVGKRDNLTKYAVGEKSTGDVLFTGPAAEQEPGKKGEPVQPKFLQSDALEEPALPEGYKEVKFENNQQPPAPQFSRKDKFAEWATSPENKYFSRAIANRIWAQYMGAG